MEAGCWRAFPPPNARKLLPDVARRFRVRRLQPGSDSALTALKGGIPDNVYNREVIPRWKERFGGASATGA